MHDGQKVTASAKGKSAPAAPAGKQTAQKPKKSVAGQKRSRDETEAALEDICAECPFSVQVIDLRDKGKKRRASAGAGKSAADKALYEEWVFEEPELNEEGELVEIKAAVPRGVDIHYTVTPKDWSNMMKYQSFVCTCGQRKPRTRRSIRPCTSRLTLLRPSQ
jgi:hypothetical protein